MPILRWIVLFPVLALLLSSCGTPSNRPAGAAATPKTTVDLLVFAPHPDDETLGCAGIIRKALAAGKRVKVVIFTNGDGFPAFAALLAKRARETMTPQDFLELARFRQTQTRTAFTALGGKPEDLVFLGYPDSALDKVYNNKSETALTQQFTGKNETYGVLQPDYHTVIHGKSAPYTYAAALADVVELIRTLQPGTVCVTNEADSHRDHKAAFWFVRDAIKAAAFKGVCDTYVVHGGPEWPWPKGITPETALEAHDVKGQQVPVGVPWPPPRRVALSRDEADFKLKAIRAHSSHLVEQTEGAMAAEREYLESFVKADEVFWPLEQK